MSTTRFVLVHGGQRRLPGALLSVAHVGVDADGVPAATLGVATPEGRSRHALHPGGSLDVPGLGRLTVRDVLLGAAGGRGRVAVEVESR